MPEPVQIASLSNGMTVLVEPMKSVQSAAFSLLVPGGCAYDSPSQSGTAAILCDWMMRGTNRQSAQDLAIALDRLGVQRSEHVSAIHLGFSGACLASQLPHALELYAEILREPLLEEDQFEPVMAGVEQSLLAIEDEPRQKVMLELVKRSYPAPWGNPSEGALEDLGNISSQNVRNQYRRTVTPSQAILGIAGNTSLEQLKPVLERAFGGWTGPDVPLPSVGVRQVSASHLQHDSAQSHIGIAYPAVAYSDPDYYQAWGAVSVLSGGMSSRLFTEVREKRGLCYSVYATLGSSRKFGQVLCYAGTTSQRAQETLDVLVAELHKLEDGIDLAEIERAQASAKSSLIMAQESTSSRASSIARDWFHLGRVTTLDEVRARVEALTPDSVLDYVRRHPARELTSLTIGPAALVTVY